MPGEVNNAGMPAVGDGAQPAAPGVDPFDAAFAEFANPEGGEPTIAKRVEETPARSATGDGGAEAAEGGLPDPAAVAAETQAAAAAAGDIADNEGGAPQEQADPAAPAAEAPDKGKQEQSALDLLTDLVKNATQQQPAAQPQQQQVQQPENPEPYTPFNAEEQQIVDQFVRDWPDVAKAQELIRRQELQAFAQYVFAQVRQPLAELYQRTTNLGQASHQEQIYATIPDYEALRDKVVEWALSDKQPGYLKRAHEQVVRQGSPDEIADLFDRYRAAAGVSPSAAPVVPAAPAAARPAAQAPAARAPAQLSDAARRAAAALAPVQSKRTSIQTDGIAPDDFDGAFAAFAKAS